MEKTQIAEAIVAHLDELLAGLSPPPTITQGTDLIGNGLLDSLNIVRLIQFVEARFDVYIDDDDISAELFTSATHLAEYVARRL